MNNKQEANILEEIKYIEYDNIYLEEINTFINESMYKFISNARKIFQRE